MTLAGKSGINPPGPDGAPTPPPSKIGQHLLTLLRLLEKNGFSHDSQMDEIVSCFQRLIASTSRRGLLQGNVELAAKVLADSSFGDSNTSQTSIGSRSIRGRRSTQSQKRSGRIENSDLRIHVENDNGANNGNGMALDIHLTLSAILRVLNSNKFDDSVSGTYVTPAILIALAANFMTATCEFVQTQAVAADPSCTIAEYELVANSGKPILVALDETVASLLQRLERSTGMLHLSSSQGDIAHALTCSLRAEASLVGLFGTKLSRSTAIVTRLAQTGWTALSVSHKDVLRAAAALLASLPFAGGLDRATPSIRWSYTMADFVALLSRTFESIAPIGKYEKSNIRGVNGSVAIPEEIKEWIDSIWAADDENHRLDSFLHLVKGLIFVVTDLLSPHTLEKTGGDGLLAASVDLPSLLSAAENLLSFPVSAESAYFTTKKRLRRESIENGCLSPSVLVYGAANQVKILGHELLDHLQTDLGSSVLLPYAKRIAQITYGSLLTASSGALRNVLEPVNSAFGDNKRRRWLQSSILTRTASVKSFLKYVLTFGCEAKVKQSQLAGISCSRDVSYTERSILVTVGYLVEQLNMGDASDPDNWGSLTEKNDLVAMCARCLSRCLVAGGDYLTVETRLLVDSVIVACLSAATATPKLPIAQSSHVKVSFLDLAIDAASVPWPNGARSSIVHDLNAVAYMMLRDSDETVSSRAYLVLRICDSFGTPRAPAIAVVRRSEQPIQSDTSTASRMKESFEDARVNIQEQEKVSRKRVDSPSQSIQGHQKKTKEGRLLKASSQPIARSPDVVIALGMNEKVKEKLETDGSEERSSSKVKSGLESVKISIVHPNDDEEDIDFPIIVDCGPDKEDT